MNPLGLAGIEFIEFATDKPTALSELFGQLGMTHTQSGDAVQLYQQNEVRFLLNWRADSAARNFFEAHGPGVSSMGWRVANATEALATALKNGATQVQEVDYRCDGKPLLAIAGIGGSLIYLIEDGEKPNFYQRLDFQAEQQIVQRPNLGFLRIDHLTNNVYQGQLREWSDFYQRIFGFTEIRYFDIRGEQTGLQSFALRSPCGTFCIPINEGTEEKSQINEFLEEYRGCGVQHIALLTEDILTSLRKLEQTPIAMLAMYPEYYADVFDRVPNVKEDHNEIQRLHVLADGDDKGYLLQIFTKNLIGPIFFEIIQRENNDSFGEGNFGALFRAIEIDQKKRGYLD
ncbi:MAG: 4-hydroxyphenylpyruvate dioxygenase [Pseudomonadota bacterium]|nr:4-hydroxyphenylpyruvate dioxygenase [Pseudomonadota bacterium]